MTLHRQEVSRIVTLDIPARLGWLDSTASPALPRCGSSTRTALST